MIRASSHIRWNHISFTRYFSSLINKSALIKIGGEIIDTPDSLKQLVRSLAILKNSGLKPIIIHGAGPQMNLALGSAGIVPEYVGGMRVTTSSTLKIAKHVFLQTNRILVDAIEQHGISARPITNGVFEAEFQNKDALGYVGQVCRIDDAAIQSALLLNQIPILSCMGETETGQALNINADVAARQLAIALKPLKTIFVTAKGGWIEEDGTKLKEIVMARDYAKMANRDYTGRQGTLLKLNEIKILLDSLPPTSYVVLTSAESLAKEVLVHSGCGTVCVKNLKPPVPSAQPLQYTSKQYKVGLLGARGYVGREIIRLLAQHPNFQLVCASSRALTGQNVAVMALSPPMNPHTNLPAANEDIPTPFVLDESLSFCNLSAIDLLSDPIARQVDIWMLALPNAHSDAYIHSLMTLNQHKLIIDLSADQRFNSDWVYGLPELPGARERLRKATHIANPGCYATGGQLAILPILSSLVTDQAPHIFGISGYSGAGTHKSDNNNLDVLRNNIIGYKPVQHIHEREMSRHVKSAVSFNPHVGEFFRGIHITATMMLKDKKVRADEIRNMYKAFYELDPLVKVSTAIPRVNDNAYQCHVQLGGFAVDDFTGRVVVYSTIDNLLKGAASQAIQNMNLATGLDEYEGLGITGTRSFEACDRTLVEVE